MSAYRSLVSLLALGTVMVAQAGLAVPSFSSRPGAAYTLYLNFGGFNFTGQWAGKTPGAVPAYTVDGDAGTFSATELDNIKIMWAGVAEKYSMFDINVTTLDPAVAAGQAGTDLARQNYYGATAQVMQTIIGGSNAWYDPNAGGVSYVGVADNSYSSSNAYLKTNWVFPDDLARENKYIVEATAHEDGHALGLSHQVDFPIGQEYSNNRGASGNGSFAPTMGVGYDSQRSLWREGTNNRSNGASIQNDVQVLLANPNLDLVDDGIGHSLATATPLGFSGTVVDTVTSQGVIRPLSESAPNPLGVDSYTKDYFAFRVTGGALSLTLNAGAQRVQAGVADPFATFAGTLNIRDAGGALIGTGTQSADTLKWTYTNPNLNAGDYYAEIMSAGGWTTPATEPTAKYYTMGSYFLSGTGNFAPVPEPASMAVLGLGLAAMRRRRRK